ncbi:hypothetical protein M422DRAFT_79357, partial [Sphaerobolus stellatus SS14]
KHVTIQHCLCKPAASALIRQGLFPCAPGKPSIAFDMNLLDLVGINMNYLAPNVSGWALTIEMFWRERGYVLGRRESLKRRFGNAFQWFTMMKEEVRASVNDFIAITRSSDGKSTDPDQGTERNVMEINGEDASRKSPKNEIDSGMETKANTVNPKPDALKEPSEHLQQCCPACFGGKELPQLHLSPAHVLVAVDANFAQTCLHAKHIDPVINHPLSYFLSTEEVEAMEKYVEEARSGKGSKKKGASKQTKPVIGDTSLSRLVPDDILEECMQSFIAAQEEIAKTSSKLYGSTGVMALLCRHDRVLWIVNLATPGEKQFYVYALLKRLLVNLPVSWHIGVLYDIACQIDRSMNKHGIFSEYRDRIHFAVSVFHAYGHQWICQLIYHPRKRWGFGFTDGEGCERFWSMMKRLIPSLRVSGHYRRIWMIDLYIHHSMTDTLWNLATRIRRIERKTKERLELAQIELKRCDVDEAEIKKEWEAQIEAQTAKMPKQSRKAGDKAIEMILRHRHEVVEWKGRLAILIKQQKELEEGSSLIRASEGQDEVTAAQKALTASMKKLLKAEKGLGIPARKRLEKLKGNGFLHHQLNAKALKSRLRAKLIAYRFERRKTIKVTKHSDIAEKDHAKAKTLVTRSKNTITSLIRKHNNLVKEMTNMRSKGVVPKASRVPTILEAAGIFALDIDSPIWLDEDMDGESVPPRWLADENMREAITHWLQISRAHEEQERLSHELRSMLIWQAGE